MKIKIVTALTSDKLENKVNDFLNNDKLEIKDVKISNLLMHIVAVILYESK